MALSALFDAQKGRYQICGPNAFNRYGFDEQIPTRVYAYNNREWGDRRIGSVDLTLIKVADKRLGDVETVETTEVQKRSIPHAHVPCSTQCDWSRFNSLPRAYEWIRKELKARQ
jgi:hypothetical protein